MEGPSPDRAVSGSAGPIPATALCLNQNTSSPGNKALGSFSLCGARTGSPMPETMGWAPLTC